MTAQELHFFDTVAPYWDRSACLSTPHKLNRLMRLGGVTTGQSVLDLGTGTGVLLPYIADAVGPAGRIVADDLSTQMLLRARQKYSTLCPAPTFLNLDFEKQDIPGRYHHIIMYCVYPHMETPLHTLRRLRADNLLPGGNILVAFPCSADRINAIHRHKAVDAEPLLPPRALAACLRAHRIPAHILSDTPDLYLLSIPAAQA